MSIKIDMEKAKVIKREIVRIQRQPELEKLDVQYQRALEQNDEVKMAEIVEMKQKLRDAPASEKIEQATSTEELNSLTIQKLTQ